MTHYKQLYSILILGLIALMTSGSLFAGGVSADLSITKDDGVTSAIPGGQITYTITASNAGPDDVVGATVADMFPAELLNCSTTCASTAPNSCTAGILGDLNDTLVDLVSGGSVVYTAVCNVDLAATGTLSNTATISSATTDPDMMNNSATDDDTVIGDLMADLSITKDDGLTTATPGDMLTYTIVASNAGPNDDPSVTLTDTLPADLICTFTSVAAGGATGNTAAGVGDLAETLSMPNGSSVTYTLTCTIDIDAIGTLSNTATITSSITDPDMNNNSATDDDTVLVQMADLSITKDDGVTSAIPGSQITYTITASNTGPNDVTGATVADTFPAELLNCSTTCASTAPNSCTAGPVAGNLNDTMVDLVSGGSVVYTAVCDIDVFATGTLSNTATVSSATVDPNMGNNSATDGDTVLSDLTADLSVTKTSDNSVPAVPGGLITYTIMAQNNGPDIDPAAVLTDMLPAALTCTYTSAAAAGATGNTAAGMGNINDVLSMPAGSSVTYSLECTIDEMFIGSLSNTANLAGSVTDPTPGNESATDIRGVTITVDVPAFSLWGLMALIGFMFMMAMIYFRRETASV